jgi:hypothetical protein
MKHCEHNPIMVCEICKTKMKNYSVEVRYQATRFYIVEAETELAAENIALKRDIKKYPNDRPSDNKFDSIAFMRCDAVAEVK